MKELLLLFLAFQMKHFICDFPLQAHTYLYKNKGTYGHLGGIIHSGIHLLGSLIVLNIFHLPIWLALIDFVSHYHIDFIKMKINNAYNLTPTSSEWFWILLGVDQMLHQLTYILLIYIILL